MNSGSSLDVQKESEVGMSARLTRKPLHIPHLNRTVSENDPVQKVLCSLMEHRTAQQEMVDDDDDNVEVEKRNRLLLDAEKARKEAALAEKRKQVSICVSWHTADCEARDRKM